MLNKISQFIERHLQPKTVEGVSGILSKHQQQLAIAALLVEVALADHHLSEAELGSLSSSLKNKFLLSQAELEELISLAKYESSHAASLHQFTQVVNQHCDAALKFNVIKAMWEMAYADGDLDKYEDHMIRKVADLIHVSHSDFIRAKSQVKAQLNN